MKLIEIENKENYNKLVKAQAGSQFLQSWEWGDFLMESDELVHRYALWNEQGTYDTVFSLIQKPLGLGFSYYYLSRADLGHDKKEIQFIFDEIKKIGRNEKVVFLRFEPLSKFKIADWKAKITKTIDVQPSQTLILDLRKSEDELLQDMHQKTRYNIRLADKKGVEVMAVAHQDIDKEFENFWNLMRITKERDAFRIHDREHYREMLKIGFIKLYLAKYNDQVLAAAIVSFFGDTATYIHGASSSEMRSLMAPYLLQWEMIKAAKGRGCRYYDFYGIDENKWPGVTRFKLGFGGDRKIYPGTYDLRFNKFGYCIYKFLRALRRSRLFKK